MWAEMVDPLSLVEGTGSQLRLSEYTYRHSVANFQLEGHEDVVPHRTLGLIADGFEGAPVHSTD